MKNKITAIEISVLNNFLTSEINEIKTCLDCENNKTEREKLLAIIETYQDVMNFIEDIVEIQINKNKVFYEK